MMSPMISQEKSDLEPEVKLLSSKNDGKHRPGKSLKRSTTKGFAPRLDIKFFFFFFFERPAQQSLVRVPKAFHTRE